ncbi:MAG: DNA polymerase IV [Cyclobacteriaceae bacterium]|nr:DNA polymerase IV [Cyclobacteriaceae bacterium]
MRKIIHIDMDAFFASIEQRDQPMLLGKPVAVGGSGKRGVVAAASYEARKFGVFSAQPSSIAVRLCPGLIFVKPRFEVYKSVSNQIREIFLEYTDLVEPLSLDEAYLDVTENKKGIATATEIALEIKARIMADTQLTASAGVSINKFLAKVASDQNKPDGIFVIKPKAAGPFVDQLPIEKFHGIGKVTAATMHRMGINTGADLKQVSREALIRRFGKTGSYYFDIARAIDHRPVNPNRIRKSLGAERTFEDDLSENEEIIVQTNGIADILFERILRAKASGKTVTLKLKFNDFEIINRSKSTGHLMASKEEIITIAMELLHRELPAKKGIRLIGLTLSNLDRQESDIGKQLTLDF